MKFGWRIRLYIGWQGGPGQHMLMMIAGPAVACVASAALHLDPRLETAICTPDTKAVVHRRRRRRLFLASPQSASALAKLEAVALCDTLLTQIAAATSKAPIAFKGPLSSSSLDSLLTLQRRPWQRPWLSCPA